MMRRVGFVLTENSRCGEIALVVATQLGLYMFPVLWIMQNRSAGKMAARKNSLNPGEYAQVAVSLIRMSLLSTWQRSSLLL
mmetsp:Transcript_35494/g.60354  ORF Transcript_35494/g.60354 Transcript_35494/m.60354 type:complete len:81 (-) Transcript_35494:1016-1258(-)